jgi:hypothetical protein
MSTPAVTSVEPVRVHVASAEPGALHGTMRRARRTVFQTITLTADDTAQPLLPAGDRLHAIVCALDGEVTLAVRQSDAGTGTGTVIPKGMPWPVVHDGAVYAGASGLSGTTTSRVSVTAVYEE